MAKLLQTKSARALLRKVDNFNTKQTHYIPHQAIRKDSDTTPVRIVYDCSCKQSSHYPSLNYCLHVGPPLSAILLHFRLYEYGFSAYIEKAFFHVQLDESDRDYICFLWLTNPQDPNSPFQPYRFKVALFGASSSPFMLNAAIIFHLLQYPAPVSTNLLSSLYVDNVISGCNTNKRPLSTF